MIPFLGYPLLQTLMSISILLESSVVTGKQVGILYQDLTDPIDKILEDDDNTASFAILHEALKESTHVFYSTDLLLNDITKLIPIFNLLNKAKPRNSRYHVMLSLRYTQQNRFSWQRMDDIFYDLSLNISSETVTLLRTHLSAIVLDWQTDRCETSEDFFSRASFYDGYGFELPQIVIDSTIKSFPYSAPKHVKNFIQLYCGDFIECSAIQVGIAYNSIQIVCGLGEYLHNQIKDAEFLVITTSYPSFRNFPFSYNMFTQSLSAMELQNEKFIGAKWNKQVYFKIDIQNQPDSFPMVTNQWVEEFPEFESLLASSKYYQEAVETLLRATREKSFRLLHTFLQRYTTETTNNYTLSSHDAILGGSLVNWIRIIKLKSKPAMQSSQLLVPHLYTDEVEASPCTLKKALGNAENGYLLVNAHTWRAAARYKQKIMDPKLNCYSGFIEDDDKMNDKAMENNLNGSTTSVILLLDNDITAMWNDVKKYITNLITEYNQIDVANLTALVFSENDLTNPITSFVPKMSKNISMGCLINMDRMRVERLKLQSVFYEELTFSKVMKGLCSPQFDKFELFIWNMDLVNWSTGREVIAVAHDIFTREFNGKRLLVQFSANLEHSMDYMAGWAEFYGVQVAF